MAVHTILWLFHGGGVVAFLIKLEGKHKDFTRAIFNAVPTTLASIFQDMHNSPRNFNVFCVKWYPPIVHDPSLIAGLKTQLSPASNVCVCKSARGF
jgi:hypothetical protein